MTTYERAIFALDELGQWEGVHLPSVRWNGWACPSFTLDTCRQIAEVINSLEGTDEKIEITEDGRIFSVWTDIFGVVTADGDSPIVDSREIEVDIVIGDEGFYPLGSHGWVWEVVRPTLCVMCGNVTGSTYEFCEVCDEIDPNPHAHLHDLPYVEPCEECGAEMTSTGDGWIHANTPDSHKCYTAYRWGVK